MTVSVLSASSIFPHSLRTGWKSLCVHPCWSLAVHVSLKSHIGIFGSWFKRALLKDVFTRVMKSNSCFYNKKIGTVHFVVVDLLLQTANPLI